MIAQKPKGPAAPSAASAATTDSGRNRQEHGGLCMAKSATLSPFYRACKSVGSRLKKYRAYRDGRAIFHKFNASLTQAIKYEGSRKGKSQWGMGEESGEDNGERVNTNVSGAEVIKEEKRNSS